MYGSTLEKALQLWLGSWLLGFVPIRNIYLFTMLIIKGLGTNEQRTASLIAHRKIQKASPVAGLSAKNYSTLSSYLIKRTQQTLQRNNHENKLAASK